MDAEAYRATMADLLRRKIPSVVKEVVTAAIDKKAEKTVVINLKGVTEMTDFIVICHGQSSRQNRAIADEIQHRLREKFRRKAFGVEGKNSTDWILLDYVDFVVHVFSQENRSKFSLEKLWMDGKRYDFFRD